MIERKQYSNAILPFINKPIIKVITGIRRCGKSTLLQQIMQLLISSKGVQAEEIVSINKELFEFDAIRNYKDLHHYISTTCNKLDRKYYIFIDEIQEIEALIN